MDPTLTIHISSPNHDPSKFVLTVPSQTTIAQLKIVLVARLDARPVPVAISEMRLIFRGRILDDKELLEHVFEKLDCEANVPTLLLSVSRQQEYSTTTSTSSASSLRFRNSASTNTATSNDTNTITNTNTNHGAVHHHHHGTSPAVSTDSNAAPRPTHAGSTTAAPANASLPTFTPQWTEGHSARTWQSLWPHQQPMQYILVNGLPYLAPASYLPALLQQQYYSLGIYGAAPLVSPDGTYFSYIPAAFPGAPSAAAAASATFATTTPAQGAPAQGDAAAGAAGQEINPQDQAARDQRRAASLWLIMKLAFGIYLFSQNGSIERIILLHIAALVIFLHQTGRLRIVRRIVQQPAADGAQAGVNPVPRPGGGAPGHVAHNQPSNANNGASGSASSSSASNAEAATVHDSDSTTIPTGPSTESSYTTEGGVHGEGVETNPVPRQQVSTWRSIEHALLTFVTSLVPAPPPEIDPAVANAAAGA